jgi:RNA polymerase sigma-70 factor, ECF subfamily
MRAMDQNAAQPTLGAEASVDPAPTPSGLLTRCQAGEPSAWREIFRRWGERIYRWAVLLGLSSADAEDAAQEVLATAVRCIGRCRAEEAMTRWLYQITRRVVSNFRQTAWLRRVVGGRRADLGAFAQAGPADAELELAARRCLRRLPRRQAEVLMMHDLIGFTRDECAEILGVPPGTVASRLLRGQEAFRRMWEGGDEKAARLEEAR